MHAPKVSRFIVKYELVIKQKKHVSEGVPAPPASHTLACFLEYQ